MKTIRQSGFLLLALSPAQMLSAAPVSPPHIALESRVLREVEQSDVNGGVHRALSTATTMRAGDRLVFVIRYRNIGQSAVAGTSIVSALPPRLAIDPGQHSRIEVSVDGGRRWDRPGATFTSGPDGRLTPATGQQVTHIRVKIDRPIAPGATGQEMFRATIL